MEKFKWYVQALAQPFLSQRSLFPGFVEVADELALGWEEVWPVFAEHQNKFSVDQISAIRRLDTYLESISGPDNLNLWTMEALEASQEWGTIRSIAQNVLDAMEWSAMPLDIGGVVFVGAPISGGKAR